MSSFVKWQKAFDTARTISLWKSESFSVRDDEDNNIIEQLNPSTRQVIQNKFNAGSGSQTNSESEMKKQGVVAFKGWKFGMSVKNDTEKEIGFQSLGEHMYFFKPLADDSVGLYRVILEGPETNVKSFEKKVKKSVEDMFDVYSKEYGAGKKINSFPAVKGLSRGYIKWLHEWDAENKHIKIGIGALLNGVEFYSVCWITDKERAEMHQTRMRNKLNSPENSKVASSK